MTTIVHKIDYAPPQTGIAFRVENAILTLAWLRAYDGFASSAQMREQRELLQAGNP